MLGQRFYQNKELLTEHVSEVSSLAFVLDGMQAQCDGERVREIMARTLRCMVIGASGVGKSSLMARLPSEGARIDEVGLEEMEAFSRSDAWADFPDVEVMVWVLSIENPWQVTLWNALIAACERLNALGRVVRHCLVLPKVDLREASQRPVLEEQLKGLTVSKVGKRLPFYSISSESPSDKGITALTAWIDGALSDSRLSELHEVYRAACEDVDRMDVVMRERLIALREDQSILHHVVSVLERSREEVARDKKGHFKLLTAMFQSVQPRVDHFLHRKMSLPNTLFSLFGKGDGALKMEQYWLDQLAIEAKEAAHEFDSHLRKRCEEQWADIRDELERRMHVSAVAFDEESFEKQSEIFVGNFTKNVNRVASKLRLKHLVDNMVLDRYHWLRKRLYVLLVLFALAGFTGGAGWGIVSVIFGMAGLGLLAVMVWYAENKRAEIMHHFRDMAGDYRYAFGERTMDDYVRDVREYYRAYAPMFDGIRRVIVKAGRDLSPLQKRWDELHLSLKMLELR